MNKVRLSRKIIFTGDELWFMRDINIGDEVVTSGRRWRRTPRKDLVRRGMRYMTESSANRLEYLLNVSDASAEVDVERGHITFLYRFPKVIRYVRVRPKPFDFGECDALCTCKCHGPSMISNCGCLCHESVTLVEQDCCKCACHELPFNFPQHNCRCGINIEDVCTCFVDGCKIHPEVWRHD